MVELRTLTIVPLITTLSATTSIHLKEQTFPIMGFVSLSNIIYLAITLVHLVTHIHTEGRSLSVGEGPKNTDVLVSPFDLMFTDLIHSSVGLSEPLT